MVFYIPSYDFYQTDSENGHKGGTAIAVKKRDSLTCVAYTNSYQYRQQVSAFLLETEMFFATIYKSLQRL
jgi:hypothetical protein